ncbi:MAG: 2-hydroxyglutaryl-CoA dehydratase [Dehalococcoidia bacterium]|nr:MAG: 2-hydroxyglutaryl-CoA dehydratase [Dehalococcoidia bacterium]
MHFAGVDIGSTMTKIVIMDGADNICSRIIGPTGPEHRRLANKVLIEALEQANLSFAKIDYVVATGYGRVNVPFADRQITELTCHARGVASLFPNVRTAIDIGGQDAKGLKIKDGKLLDFVMNDKCAAGTGRFLEVLAETLGLELEDLGGISLESTKKIPISSTCTIFAQQEVIARISEGLPLEDIVAGVHDALAGRVARMVQRLRVEPDVVLTGGVAKNVGVVKAIKEHLKCDVLVPAEPLLTGATGAAILGKELVSKAMAAGELIERKERYLEEVTFFK